MKSFILIFSFCLFAVSKANATFIPWEQLKNPVYERANWSVKDASMIYHEPSGYFYIFFSAFFESDGAIRSHVSGVKTKDFVRFSEPLFVWSGKELGFKGFAAPEVRKIENRYVMTYNSWGDKLLKPNRLYYATSTDLENWDKHKPLAEQATKFMRAIDANLTFANGMYVLNWKEFQDSRIATAPSLDGPWTRIGKPLQQWMENGQFIKIGNKWNLIYTGDQHLPFIVTLLNSGTSPQDWIKWGEPRQLQIPLQRFNTEDRANAAHLADWRERDGYFYLLYAGNTELTSYLGRGHNKLGLARSRDGVTWEVPPAR